MLMLLSFNLLGQKDYGFLPPINHIVGAETRSSICVPSPSTDRPWDFNRSFEDQVNEAIDVENLSFGKSYSNYVHPSYNANDPLDISRKVLNELRRVYRSDGIAELDIEYDQSVMDLAINHSCAMDLDNQFCHTCPSDGTFQGRVNDMIGRGCYQRIGENIAWISTTNLESSILRIIYLMMYADVACCDNGHRDTFLHCDYNENTKVGFGIIRGDIQSSSGAFVDSWIMTWDYVTYWSYPDCGDCNCNVSIGTPLCNASSGVVLPVELKDFTASAHGCKQVLVNWSTFSEINNDYFILERSANGENWEEITNVNGANNSSKLMTYAFNDQLKDVIAGTIFYRLTQVDFDGNSTSSDIISVERPCNASTIMLFPNPTNSNSQIVSANEIISIEIYDLSGKLVSKELNPSNNSIKSQYLEPGIYLIKIVDVSGSKETLKLIRT